MRDVLVPAELRRQWRNRSLSSGQVAAALNRWVQGPNPSDRADAISLGLELEQVDPEEPAVRELCDLLHGPNYEDRWEPSNFAAGRSTATIGDDLLYARFMLAVDKPRAAEKELAAILSFDAGNPVAQVLLFRAFQLQSKLREAMRIWEGIVQCTSCPSALTELRALYEQAAKPEARATKARPTRADPVRAGLEYAFQAAASGRVSEAIAACSRLAEEYRHSERDSFKLVALAHAWLLELGGRQDLARRALEQLDGDPFLADDLDRLTSLARVLEADASAVGATIATYERVFEKTSNKAILVRLARLHERAGRPATALALRARHKAAFDQELGLLTLRQLLRVTSHRHVSLFDLCPPLSFDDLELASVEAKVGGGGRLGNRKRAVLAFLRGRPEVAEHILLSTAHSGQAEPIDLSYLADLALLDNRLELASVCYRQSLAAARRGGAGSPPLDPSLAPAHAVSPAAVLAASPECTTVARARDSLADIARQHARNPKLLRLLASASRALGRDDDGNRLELRAQSLERCGSSGPPPGHVLAVAAYHARGDRKGMVHELWVSRYRTRSYGGGQLAERDIFANITDDFRLYLRSVFESVKAYSRAKFPHIASTIDDYAYQFKLTNEDERSSGPSAGLAIGAALVSLFFGKPVPCEAALSGVLVTEARDRLSLRRVGDADIKIEGALARRAKKFILPKESQADVEQSDVLPIESARQLAVYVQDFDEALEALFGREIWLW